MSDGQSAGSEEYHYYRRLLKGHWPENGICWTVVVPNDGRPLTLTEIDDRCTPGIDLGDRSGMTNCTPYPLQWCLPPETAPAHGRPRACQAITTWARQEDQTVPLRRT
ncbi:hypothetical protein Psi01_16170 [Planobispora siamensis]|uniref:Uncharacterized protein n=1 Tax=Planobispora siamensis TaxID=936338 RepID=A0A8J3SDS8_9ACTN|nr:hypothetical protein Psi01_16170 [Planobispora siamensis]